jgi:imidazolonepropionase-like amidohydrolase
VNRLISIVVIRGLLILLMLSVLVAEEARAQTEASVERVVALRAGGLLEVETGNLIADAVVLIRGERIEAVGPQVRIPPEAEVIDLSDYVVLPGLIDAHTHVCMQPDYAENNPILYKSIPYRTVEAVNAVRATLEAGFTTIRDIDSEGADWADVAVRDGINDGLVPGPRMQVATLAISITGGYMNQNGLAPQIDVPQFGALADSPAALVAEVRRQVKYETDWIKIYATGTTRNIDPRTMQPLPQFSYEDLKLVVDEAARFRTPVAAHAYGGPGAKNAIRAGVRSIEHGFFLDDEALDMMVANGTFWVPTISVYIPDSPREEWGELRKAIIDGHAWTIRRATEKGVKIAYGTDAGALPHGDNAIDFERMVAYGMTPLQAVQSATLTAAELMQMDGDVGTLTPGAFADLIAVPTNPLDAVAVLGDVRFVMKGGAVIKHVAASTAGRR